MKKLICFCISTICFITIISNVVYAKDLVPNTHYAVVIDSNNNEVLYDKKSHEVVAMASTTKIITSLIAINYCDLNEVVTVSKTATAIRGAKIGLTTGEKLTVNELLYGLMLKSGNDAAIALAEHIGGSIAGFSKIMNDFSKEIGLVDTNFESPHGLDSSMHFSSAYDLAIATSKAMDNATFKKIVSTKEISSGESGFTRDYRNINKILRLVPNANGVKTGYTGQAGKCLVSSFDNNGSNIIVVVLNSPNRWEDTKTLYEHSLKIS